MSKRKVVEEIWPEWKWIQCPDLRKKNAQTRRLALQRLETCKVSILAHRQTMLQPACESTLKQGQFLGDDKPVDQDFLMVEAILTDAGGLFELEKSMASAYLTF